MTHDEMLVFYSTPGVFTGLDDFRNDLASLGGDAASIVGFVQGLLIHEAFGAADGVAHSPERVEEKQIHAAGRMLTYAKRLDWRPADAGAATGEAGASAFAGISRRCLQQ